MKRWRLYTISRLVGFVLVLGWSAVAEGAEARSPIRVLTTLPPLYSLAANVAGDHAVVENLLPPNVGPHDVQLTPRDLRRLALADVVIQNGLGLEPWLEKAIRSARGKKPLRRIGAVTGVPPDRLLRLGGGEDSHDHAGHTHKHGHSQEVLDPHVWLDPQLAATAVTNILTVLTELDPGHRTEFERNAKGYLEKLALLEAEMRSLLDPVKAVPFITMHDAFGYLVRRFGLRVVGVVELTPDVEPSPRQLARLYRVIREQGAKAIFAEPQFPAKLAKQVAADAAIRVGELDPLETGDFSREFYERGMRRNARALVDTLQ